MFDADDKKPEFCAQIERFKRFIEEGRVLVDTEFCHREIGREPIAFANMGQGSEFVAVAVLLLLFGEFDFIIIEEELTLEADIIGENTLEKCGDRERDDTEHVANRADLRRVKDDGKGDERDDDEDAHDLERFEEIALTAFEQDDEKSALHIGTTHEERAQEREHAKEHDAEARVLTDEEGVFGLEYRREIFEFGFDETADERDDADDDDRENERLEEELSNENGLSVCRLRIFVFVCFFAAMHEAFGQNFGEFFRDPIGVFEHIGHGNGGDDADDDDDGIEVIREDAFGDAHARDNEREFADISKTHARVHGFVERTPREGDAERGHDGLNDDDDGEREQDDAVVVEDDRGVGEHPNGDEEDGAKEIFERRHEGFDVVGLRRRAEDRTDDEGAKRRGQPRAVGEHDHAETERERKNEEEFVREVIFEFSKERRNEENPAQKPQRHEENDAHDRAGDFLRERVGLAHRDHGQNDEQEDGDDILDDLDAIHDVRKRFPLEFEFLKGLDGDHRGRNGEHTAHKNALRGAPIGDKSNPKRGEHDARENGKSRDSPRFTDLEQALKIEFKTEREEQKNDANFRPRVNAGFVDHTRQDGNVGSREESREEISDDDGEFGEFADDRRATCRDEDEREIRNERIL